MSEVDSAAPHDLGESEGRVGKNPIDEVLPVGLNLRNQDAVDDFHLDWDCPESVLQGEGHQ